MNILYLFVILTIVVNGRYQVFGANILYLESIISKSHDIWNSIIAKELLKNGHIVTSTSLEKKFDVHPNYTVIHFEGVTEKFEPTVNLIPTINYTNWQMRNLIIDWWVSGCDLIYESKDFEKLLQLVNTQSFDLIISDISLGECFHPIIAKLRFPPTIGVSVFVLPSHNAYAFGNHLHSSYIPWHSLVYGSNNMTFYQRMVNFFFTTLDVFYTPQVTLRGKLFENMVQKKFGENFDMSNVTRHISLILANVDSVLYFPQPLPPNIIPVAGLHLRKAERKNIPKDLLEILDSSSNGVILFSLGTNIKSDHFDEIKKKAFLDAFKRLPYTVIWKYENTDINQKNVITRKRFPQQDILGHPNTKLFISHGGVLSTQEAIFHGVPFIGVPFFADQPGNVNILVEKKAALKIDYNTVNSDTIFDTINEIITNPMYSNNIKKMSELFKDQPQTPKDRALFWIEYVLRHKKTPHLDPIARDLPWYISSSADVLFFTFCLLLSVIWLSILTTRKLCSRIYCLYHHNKIKQLVKTKSC